jgi:hypothetical protein
MTATDVAHELTISKIHISVAKAKMAMTRCWIIVRLLMPNQSVGINQRVNVTSNTKNILMSLKVALLG